MSEVLATFEIQWIMLTPGRIYKSLSEEWEAREQAKKKNREALSKPEGGIPTTKKKTLRRGIPARAPRKETNDGTSAEGKSDLD